MDKTFDTLVKKTMTFNTYEDPQWSGWEYVPITITNKVILCDIVNHDTDIEFICLQYCPKTVVFKIAVDCNVWEVSKEAFTDILQKVYNTLNTAQGEEYDHQPN